MATYDRLAINRAVDDISDAFIFHSSYSRTNHKMYSVPWGFKLNFSFKYLTVPT